MINYILYFCVDALEWRHNGPIASQITSLTIVYSIVYSDADQRKHPSSASLAFVRVIHRGPVNSPHKWPVTRKMFPFDDVIMVIVYLCTKFNAGFVNLCSKNRHQNECSHTHTYIYGRNSRHSLIQSSAVIARSNLSRYHTQHWHDSGRT